MGAALRGKDFMVSEVHFNTFCRRFALLLSKIGELIFLESSVSNIAGPGSSRAGVEAADWRGRQLE